MSENKEPVYKLVTRKFMLPPQREDIGEIYDVSPQMVLTIKGKLSYIRKYEYNPHKFYILVEWDDKAKETYTKMFNQYIKLIRPDAAFMDFDYKLAWINVHMDKKISVNGKLVDHSTAVAKGDIVNVVAILKGARKLYSQESYIFPRLELSEWELI